MIRQSEKIENTLVARMARSQFNQDVRALNAWLAEHCLNEKRCL
jgi:hypothetical protein